MIILISILICWLFIGLVLFPMFTDFLSTDEYKREHHIKLISKKQWIFVFCLSGPMWWMIFIINYVICVPFKFIWKKLE